ncbi:uncharacterized protein LOC135848701 [Planococcus citri]|uniref:uncharacterized protein LOC135848701 n=1 Tax=Planococcus citri TaxID=170843 RepID=UPI0031F9A242
MLYRNTWNPESDDDFYKFCYDDETVTKATKAMMINDADSMHFKLFRIKSNSNSMLPRGPMYKWYTIVKLYNMHENLKAEKTDENSKSEQEGEKPKPEKEAENQNDKKELVDLMTEMGENTQYERIFESLKAADKPLLTKIWTAFKDNGKKPEENNPYQRWGSSRFPWMWSRFRTWSNRY